VPANEIERLAALDALHVLDTLPEPAFDHLVHTAALACGTPISLLSLVDADRQWFKAGVGLPGVAETARDRSFCAHAILQDDVLEIPDATLDARFAENPLVIGDPDMRFYAGAPLRLEGGLRIGTLCVIGRQAGRLTPTQRTLLRRLSAVAVELLQARRTAHALSVSEARLRSLVESSPSGTFATAVEGSTGQVLQGDAPARDQVLETAREVVRRTTHDPLSGLVNRIGFETRLKGALERTRAHRGGGALMHIDLDRFRLINDACGRAAGDRLLAQVAMLVRDTVRGSATLARLDGDEFGVMVENCSAAQAWRVAQRVRGRLEAYRFAHGEQQLRVRASIGIAPLDDRWRDPGALMRAAHASCRAAKEAGRDRVHAWLDADRARMIERQDESRWVTRLEQALDDERFVLHLQRIEPLGPDGVGLHAEVLVRLRDLDGSLVMPDDFLPAAERFDLVTPIDLHVLRHALQALGRLIDVMDVEMLCVNLSGRSIGDGRFHRDAIALLSNAGSEVCHRLCLEVTETSAVSDPVGAARFIDGVRAFGVRVALDDFGAGASSFGYLKTLRVDMIKIDGQFVRNLADDPLDEAVVRCFVEIARVMGLKTVAEFVDSPRTLRRIGELGVDFAQGFQVHRPHSVDALIDEAGRMPGGTSGRASGLRSEDEPGDQADHG